MPSEHNMHFVSDFSQFQSLWHNRSKRKNGKLRKCLYVFFFSSYSFTTRLPNCCFTLKITCYLLLNIHFIFVFLQLQISFCSGIRITTSRKWEHCTVHLCFDGVLIFLTQAKPEHFNCVSLGILQLFQVNVKTKAIIYFHQFQPFLSSLTYSKPFSCNYFVFTTL